MTKCCGTCAHGNAETYARHIVCTAPYRTPDWSKMPSSVRVEKYSMSPTDGALCPCWAAKEAKEQHE